MPFMLLYYFCTLSYKSLIVCIIRDIIKIKFIRNYKVGLVYEVYKDRVIKKREAIL